MKFEGKERRMRERMKLSLPARVRCRETQQHEWVEMTRLLDVTPFGASFTLTHPTEPGRLLHLTLPLPRQLRCFDHVEDQYRVWALVRRVKLQKASGASPTEKKTGGGGDGGGFVVGVAFVGKRPPASYDNDPSIRYDVAPSPLEEGRLLGLSEMDSQSEAEAGATGQRSVETRLQIPVEMIIEVIGEQGAATMREETVTENISKRGASVLTSLDVGRGRYVRVTGTRTKLTVFAAVRARRTGADGIPRLHLEFIDGQWPLEGVE